MGGMTGLLLLLWAGVTVGRVVDLQKRIIGGHDCTAKERGYHVFLTFSDGTDMFVCGGSLISKEWILTAAHCWKTGPQWTVTAVFGGHLYSGTKVTLGSKHEIFNVSGIEHDIMLLKLPKPTKIPHVSPPDCKHQPQIGDTVQIAGYYSTARPGDNTTESHNIIGSKPLQCADTKVAKCSNCHDSIEYPHIFCYKDGAGKVDTTGGDSGGGVVFKDMIYGVHVRGGEIACAVEAAAMDICEKIYKDWIIKTTGILWPRR